MLQKQFNFALLAFVLHTYMVRCYTYTFFLSYFVNFHDNGSECHIFSVYQSHTIQQNSKNARQTQQTTIHTHAHQNHHHQPPSYTYHSLMSLLSRFFDFCCCICCCWKLFLSPLRRAPFSWYCAWWPFVLPELANRAALGPCW